MNTLLMNTLLKRWAVYSIILLTFLFIASPTICQDNEDNKVIISYPTKEGIYYTESQPNIFQLKKEGDYEVVAYIRPVTEKKERILNTYQIDLTRLKGKYPFIETEITDRGLLVFQNNPERDHLSKENVKFDIPLPEQGIEIEEYPFFKIAYEELNPVFPVNMGVKFYLDTDNDGEIDTVALARPSEAISENLVKSIDFSKATFVSKSYSYLLYRKLGIKMDEKWRYVQDGENVVIQRRFYEDLKEVPLIKLFFDKRYKVSRINFMVDFNKNKIPDAIIEFEDTIHKSFSKGDLDGIEINLLESVRRLFPNKKDIFLTEVFIFVRGNKENIIRQMPLKRLGFYQTEIEELEKDLIPVRTSLEKRKEEMILKIDLSEMENENIYIGKIKEAHLILKFSDKIPNGIVLKDMRFYDAVEEDYPTLFNLVTKALDKRIPLSEKPSKEAVLVPKILFCNDFSTINKIATLSHKVYKDNLLKIIPHHTQYQLYRTEEGTKVKFYFNGDEFEEESLLIKFPFLPRLLKDIEELEFFYEVQGKIDVYALIKYKDHKDLLALSPKETTISFSKTERPLTLDLLIVPRNERYILRHPVFGKLKLAKMILKGKGRNHLISFSGGKFLFPQVKSINGWQIKSSSNIEIENTASGLKISYKGGKYPKIVLEKDLNIEIGEDTYLWCDYEASDIIPYLKLVERGERKNKEFILSPRLSVRLDSKITHKKIKKIILSLKSIGRPSGKFVKKEWTFILKRIEIFRIKPMQEANILSTYLPPTKKLVPISFTEVPSSSRECLILTEENKATAIWYPLSHSPLKLPLKCKVNRRVQDILGLFFKYKADPDLLRLNPYWLRIVLYIADGGDEKKIILRPYLPKSRGGMRIPIKEKILEKIGKENNYLLGVDFDICIDKIPITKRYLFEIKDVFISEFRAFCLREIISEGELMKIDDNKFSAQALLSKDNWNNFFDGGTWVNLGKYSFSEGEHEIEFTKHKYLKIDALLLKGEVPISAALLKPKIHLEPLSGRVIGWGLKLIFWGFILFCLYLIYHFRRLYMPLWDRIWGPIPIKLKVIAFPILGLCLYILGLKRKVGQGENYLFTFGGIFVVLGYHYLSLLLKPWWLRHHERVATFIYRSSGSIYIVGFIITLIIAAFFLVFGVEPIADQVSIIGYYLLVVGVIKEFLAFKKSTSNY